MSDVIRLLPDSVANQIAAGEVIQRPASVVKELVENAIDAGALHIDVSVTDAGRTCIRVIDDGKGMSETDARMAFERHATSKIREASDLFSLHTMGLGVKRWHPLLPWLKLNCVHANRTERWGRCLKFRVLRLKTRKL